MPKAKKIAIIKAGRLKIVPFYSHTTCKNFTKRFAESQLVFFHRIRIIGSLYKRDKNGDVISGLFMGIRIAGYLYKRRRIAIKNIMKMI